MATVDLYTAGRTIVLGDFGPTQSGTLTDADGTLGTADNGIATFASQPITYIGSGTATPGVAVPGPLIIPLGASVDVVVFESGGQVYFHYPDGPPDFTSAVALVLNIDTTAYPLFTPVCFHADTLISTPHGHRPAGKIRAGQLVLDIHGRAHTVVWTGRRHVALGACDDTARTRLAPVVIPPGLLGQAGPRTGLRVSRNHLILIRHPKCAYYFGADAVLVKASALLGVGATLDLTTPAITYVHLMCDSHVILNADGLEAETFLPGPQAVAALTPSQRLALMRCPGATTLIKSMAAAAPVLSQRDARFLLTQVVTTGDIRKAG
ncbi:Hint domain-containing protein [Pseudooceanicola onchidii]|uniref:Hint domain-containing protein n=1 Tax=Pseudooceanicola onchidii TaxID=2562279 RepID=UPI00145BD6D3|nr:Hint domain-containing protein [Pseudooceanicola onchidii]